MIIADTQLAVYATIRGPNTELARRVFAKDRDWSAPVLWRSEYRNALLGHVRRQDMTFRRATLAFSTAERMFLGREYVVETRRVFALAADNRITAYDLEFVALARQLSAPLVTFDKEVLAAFPNIAISPEAFAA
ncbi:MAG: type II toxin-antitoxin system VapC family toxin [Chloroflexi bacterium]|nr:type II toxin-antitoxin system VapC family toxin [Chloroflexota bacterium]